MSTTKPSVVPVSEASSTRAGAAEATPDRGKEEAPGVYEVGAMGPDTPHRSSVTTASAPPLPEEHGTTAPPLPMEAPPAADDGWDPVWDDTAQAYYFYNRFTQQSQWTNPRVPDITQPAAPGVGNYDRMPDRAPGTEDLTPAPQRPYGGYDPAIHGDYDPTASYAQEQQAPEEVDGQPADPAAIYTATGVFNRFTGKWQPHNINPENHNDENKSKRQMSAFFDVDAAANSHNGKSLKAERSGKKLSKQELKAFKEKRKEKKEEKRRAWLRD
ncbi:MAG: hypothetical protein Q9175_001913 [Cornicularia normoerica]